MGEWGWGKKVETASVTAFSRNVAVKKGGNWVVDRKMLCLRWERVALSSVFRQSER